jgi:hypothetical protein
MAWRKSKRLEELRVARRCTQEDTSLDSNHVREGESLKIATIEKHPIHVSMNQKRSSLAEIPSAAAFVGHRMRRKPVTKRYNVTATSPVVQDTESSDKLHDSAAAESEYSVAKQRALEGIGPRGFGQLQFIRRCCIRKSWRYLHLL